MKKSKLLFLSACNIVLLLAFSASFALTRRVLFIGNSYTYTNSMPAMLQAFAAAKGDTLVFNQSDPGGYTLEQHSTYGPTLSLIFSQPWDIVVLQEQSELPSFPPAEVDTQVYPYAHLLDSMIHANDSCTQTMFMMTWGHADGDPANCSFYPVICTYAGMQQRLRQSYLQMTQDNNAIVAPVGAAWQVMRDSFPGIWLYQSDSVHPILPGSYLQTCVLYSSIFHRPASGCTYLDGVSPSDAATIQHVADQVTMDSLEQWQQYGHYPYAGFTYTLSGYNVSFGSNDPVTARYQWNFGDGATDTATNPTHHYGTNGTYVVSHTAYNNCFFETLTDTLNIATTGITGAGNTNEYPLSIMHGDNGAVTIASQRSGAYDDIDIYAADGRNIGHYLFSGDKVHLQLAPGLYIYRASSHQKNRMSTGKFVAY